MEKQEPPEKDQSPFSGKKEESNLQRLKRDEWSEGAVSSLLNAYESKWALRNRAKLKGHDWEDVSRHVSSRTNCTKAPKTSTQCKNKIESMKKRYRSEVAAPDPTSWPLFPRLDSMLRGGGGGSGCAGGTPQTRSQPQPQPLMLLDPPPPPSPPRLLRQDLHEFNGAGAMAEEEASETHNLKQKEEEKLPPETESSTPVYDGHRETSKTRLKMKKRSKKKHKEEFEVAESVRWLAEVMLRSEQARMETMKELERIRAETEAQRAKIDLKRTEIMANTQLQIARILSGKEEAIDSSLRIGRS
ncbi:trihelix transcription factor ENAP1-like isoform X2 [Aristolochia californica]|uniref:trihelix transcription factor ENAP1-like isoform X2 n=1 Tax=Aristolochia californica TaxID=171875 RepID=UPI0035D609EE